MKNTRGRLRPSPQIISIDNDICSYLIYGKEVKFYHMCQITKHICTSWHLECFSMLPASKNQYFLFEFRMSKTFISFDTIVLLILT